jgi:hypothetical protein
MCRGRPPSAAPSSTSLTLTYPTALTPSTGSCSSSVRTAPSCYSIQVRRHGISASVADQSRPKSLDSPRGYLAARLHQGQFTSLPMGVPGVPCCAVCPGHAHCALLGGQHMDGAGSLKVRYAKHLGLALNAPPYHLLLQCARWQTCSLTSIMPPSTRTTAWPRRSTTSGKLQRNTAQGTVTQVGQQGA